MSGRLLAGLAALLGLAFAAGTLHAGEAFRLLDRASARELVAPARTPTLIALWSIDCVHCKANLQTFAALAKRHPQVRIVSVAVEPYAAELAEPLDRAGLPGPRYAYGDDAPEALAYALDPAWRGELPRTLLFDGRGGRRAISGRVDAATARFGLGLN